MPGAGNSYIIEIYVIQVNYFLLFLGKTATIIALIELLVELGNSVLITSHTHAAVDNVCVRLKKQGVKVLRLGAVGRIHSEIQTMSEYELTKNCKTPEQLEQVYANAVS